jgi:hypothetical protein
MNSAPVADGALSESGSKLSRHAAHPVTGGAP